MFLDPQPVSSEKLGSLQGCLVGGDPAQRSRERKVRRRALAISVALQSALVATLVLVPLFAKPPIIATTSAPVPIYEASRNPQRSTSRSHDPIRRTCVVCINLSKPAPLMPGERLEAAQPEQIGEDVIGGGPMVTCPTCIPIGTAQGPRAPVAETPVTRPRILREPQIDPAMLIRRVEPVYPILARQTGRSGRVELHAIIATDGTIRSLQVVSGDPLFYQSAREAVLQWRYKPTVLNGQPVEVDTFITVIYIIR